MQELFKLGLVACDIVPEKQARRIGHSEHLTLSFPHRRSVVLFRAEWDKEAFMKVGVHWVSPKGSDKLVLDYKHDILGLYLGYPPAAVTSYMRGNTDCTMYFGGTGFRARYADLEDNLDYLCRHYGSTGFKCSVRLDAQDKSYAVTEVWDVNTLSRVG